MNKNKLSLFVKIGIFNLTIVAMIGTLMRYKIGFDFPYFDQKYLLHGHSDFAFAGWVTHILFTLLAFLNQQNIQESFPFYRDPPKSLIVTPLEQDTAMLATLQPVATGEIGYAEKAGFCIHPSDSLEAYRKVWPMFGQLADRKGFHLTDRRLDDWLDAIEAARKHGCSQLYTASLGGVCVSAIHLLRYGQTVEFMLGALDVRLLGDNPSPSALLHWRAMRDFHRVGCRFYNLGGPGDGVHNKVYPFKRKFRPELRVAEPPVTIVLNPGAYRCWDLFFLKGWLGSKRIAKAGFHKGKRAVNQLFSKPRAGQAPDEQGETPRSPNS